MKIHSVETQILQLQGIVITQVQVAGNVWWWQKNAKCGCLIFCLISEQLALLPNITPKLFAVLLRVNRGKRREKFVDVTLIQSSWRRAIN